MSANTQRNEEEEAGPMRELVITRVFDAPRQIVFDAWTDPQQIARWWGPHHFTNENVEIEPRAGGKFNIDMRAPDGTLYPNRGTVQEVVAPERFVFTSGMPPAFEVLNTITFAEIGGKTKVTLNARVLNATGDAEMYLAGMEQGWSETLERLVDVVAGPDEIATVRFFDAPRELVFRMFTEERHLAKWWGPNGFEITTFKFDMRTGGEWRFIMHGPGGTDYKNHTVYSEVVSPERIVYDHVSTPHHHTTITFSECGDKTRVAFRMGFDSAELRDNVAQKFGAIEGLQQTLGRLEEHLPNSNAQEFVISRTFNAPRDLVFSTWTDCKHLAQWWGPKGSTVLKCDNDFRPGGIFHYGLRAANGDEMYGKWVYREIVKPQRLVFISSFADADKNDAHHPMAPTWPMHTLSTILFAEEEGKTTVTVRWIPDNPTEEERKTFESAMPSMTGGWTGTFDQFDAYLSTLTK